jgi:nucleotidyltransferase/DNA polymerase involved in DNA repair
MSVADQNGHLTQAGDLDKIKGIGPRFRAILKDNGVASIKELRHHNPARLKEMIENRHGAVAGLSERQMGTWIDEATSFEE